MDLIKINIGDRVTFENLLLEEKSGVVIKIEKSIFYPDDYTLSIVTIKIDDEGEEFAFLGRLKKEEYSNQ